MEIHKEKQTKQKMTGKVGGRMIFDRKNMVSKKLFDTVNRNQKKLSDRFSKQKHKKLSFI